MAIEASGLLLFPGAGSDSTLPALVAISDGIELPVRLADFPYRKAGKRFPDRAPKLIEAVIDEAELFADELGVTTSELVLGGRSMGGRIASMVVADAAGYAGLVVMSYPLHPPGKPEKLRIEHLAQLNLPVLSIAGDRDPFGTPDELAEHFSVIPGDLTSITLEGVGHDLRRSDDAIVATIAAWLGEREPAAG